MLQKNNRYKLMSIFFDDPKPEGIGFQLRELSRKIKLAPTSVKNYLKEFEKENLILRSRHRIHNYPVYYANRDNENFKFQKKEYSISLLNEIGLIEFINEELMPDVIILFGSMSKGEDLKDSDVDLFVLCKKSEINLKKFEKLINRKINIFFSNDFNILSKELKNNIINGTILKGYLKVF